MDQNDDQTRQQDLVGMRSKSSPPATVFAALLIAVVVAIVGYIMLSINFSTDENAAELEKSQQAIPPGQTTQPALPGGRMPSAQPQGQTSGEIERP